MFVILSYDVNAKRTAKVMRVCRRYLSHIHESLFEGNLTPTALKRLKRELEEIIDVEYDSIVLYKTNSYRYTSKELLGTVNNSGETLW